MTARHNGRTWTTIQRIGQWNDKAFSDIPDKKTFDNLFSVKFNYPGAESDLVGMDCPCKGLAGYCPETIGSVGWFNENTRCTCFTNSIGHCPSLGSNKALRAANVGDDAGRFGSLSWNRGANGGCKNDICEDGDDATYRAGYNCMKSLDEKVRDYKANCTYPASTVPNDGHSGGETNELKTLSASDDDERQLLKNYCWRVDPDSVTNQPFAITNSDCQVLRDDNAKYRDEVNKWCTGQLDKLVSMKQQERTYKRVLEGKSPSVSSAPIIPGQACVMLKQTGGKPCDGSEACIKQAEKRCDETPGCNGFFYYKSGPNSGRWCPKSSYTDDGHAIDNKGVGDFYYTTTPRGCDCRDPKKRCAECDGRKKDGMWRKGEGGCDCWNDLIHDKEMSAAVGQMNSYLKLPGADCAWMNCITPRATTAETNLYPDKENECPPPPKCSQVINVAKGGKIEGGIVQNFNCDSSPGPPKPSPSPSVWDKIKNFLKRVNPKVLIAPAAILAIAIIVGIYEKRKGK